MSERTEVTPSTCRVTDHHVEISLMHFTKRCVAFKNDQQSVAGKFMSLMPFLPRKMTPSRTMILEFRMVQKPKGTSWKDLHTFDESYGLQPAKNDDDVMEVKDESLEVTCQLNGKKPLKEEVSSCFLKKVKHTVYFTLDFKGKADDLPLNLKLKQNENNEMDIKFMTEFIASTDAPSSSLPKRTRKTTTQTGSTLTIKASGDAKVKGNSMTGSVINMTTNNYAAGKGQKVGGKRSGTKRKSNDSNPGPSTSHKKKKVRPDDSDDTKVTDDIIESLAEDIGTNTKLDKLGLALGFGFPAIKMYKAKNHPHGDVTYAGTKEMLIDWRDEKGEGNPAILKEALIKAKLAMLTEKYFRDV